MNMAEKIMCNTACPSTGQDRGNSVAVCHLLVGQEEIPGRDESKHESSGWAVHSQDECLS